MTPTGGAAVSCRNVTVGYGPGSLVIPELDLEVDRGEMVALLGPSGSGKTTILSVIAGFLRARSGEIEVGGRLVAGPDRHEPPERRDLAVVFQGYALWPHMNALDTVAFPIRRRGVVAAEARREAAHILDVLAIGHLADRRPAELSGGEQQRVGLGRALARNASLYLFDEPTAHLDAALRERLQSEIVLHRRQSGAGALYATHDTSEALALADRVVLIRGGRIVQQGEPAAVYSSPVDLWAARLTGPASIIDVRLDGRGPGRVPVDVAGCAQSVEVGSADPVVAGPIRAVVRPDWVRLGGDLPATVEMVAFRGPHTDYRLATPAGSVGLRVPGRPVIALGEAISWTLERLWVVGDDASRPMDVGSL